VQVGKEIQSFCGGEPTQSRVLAYTAVRVHAISLSFG
jgi:hypothetical protein